MTNLETFVEDEGDRATYRGDDGEWSIGLDDRPDPELEELRAALASRDEHVRRLCLSRFRRRPLLPEVEALIADALDAAETEDERAPMIYALRHAELDRTKEVLRGAFDDAAANRVWRIAREAALALASAGDGSRVLALVGVSDEIPAPELARTMLRLSNVMDLVGWPQSAVDRLAGAHDADAQYVVQLLAVAHGRGDAEAVCRQAILAAGDQVAPLWRALSLLRHLPDTAARTRIGVDVFRQSNGFVAQLSCVGLSGFPAELREEFVRTRMLDPNPGHRYHATGVLRLLPRGAAESIKEAWLEREPDERVRAELGRLKLRNADQARAGEDAG